MRSYEYQITRSGFNLQLETEPGLPPIPVDRDSISQAILNLLNNAIKYSAETKSILVSVRLREGNIEIVVADKGIGIPRSELKKIFEKFYRVSAGLVHDTRGSGLGLALVKHIVEAHGGDILVDSTPGKGSQFTIVLPVPGSEKASEAGRDKLGTGGYRVAENLDS